MIVALLVFGAAALAIWLAQRGGAPAGSATGGLVPLPPHLNPQGLPVAAETDAVAPDFELETLNGQRFRLSDWRGHSIMLNFWASWCVPCRKEVPVLIRIQERYRDDGLLIVGVNIEEPVGPAQDFVDEFGINYVIPMDFGGEVTREYLRVGPPNTYFIRPDGTIHSAFFGQAPDEVFEQRSAELVALLDAPVATDAADD